MISNMGEFMSSILQKERKALGFQKPHDIYFHGCSGIFFEMVYKPEVQVYKSNDDRISFPRLVGVVNDVMMKFNKCIRVDWTG